MPGPGTYTNNFKKLKLKAPTFVFGSSKRDPLAPKTQTPGPGSYKINVNFANVPDYALPKRDPSRKFV